MQLTVAWLNLTMPNQTVKNGLKAKKIKLPQMIFFLKKTTNKIFMYLLAPFILRNLKKFLEPIQSYEICHFRVQNGLFVLNKIFWYKPLLLLSSTYWPKLKEILTVDPEL